MSNLVASATRPLVNRLPGAVYYDRSMFLNARQVRRYQLLHSHETKATLQAVSSSSSPSPLSFCPLDSHGFQRHDRPALPSSASSTDPRNGMQMSAPFVCVLFSLISLPYSAFLVCQLDVDEVAQLSV
jgi:hypothetical protein